MTEASAGGRKELEQRLIQKAQEESEFRSSLLADPKAAIERLAPLTQTGNPWRPSALDLTAVSGKPQRCARRIVFLAAGTATLLKDSGGHDEPTPVLAGDIHDADTSAITCATAFRVYW